MLEGLFKQIANQIPPKVPPDSLEKSPREPLQPRFYKPIPWILRVHSEKYKTQNTQSLSDQDRQKLLDYLAAIGETDLAMIQEVLTICARNSHKRAWLLQWADQILPVPKVDISDDRHYCRECGFMKKGRCQQYGFRPVDNIPRRCVDYQFKP